MKNLVLIFSIIFIGLQFSCDRVEIAYRDVPELDSTLYPGVWGEYVVNVWPTFEQNTNTYRNVIIDDFTGHKCSNCVKASKEINEIVEANPGRVYYAAIHSGPGGETFFQDYDASAPDFFTNHMNPMGLFYGQFFQTGFGFIGNPGTSVSRELFGGQNSGMFVPYNQLQSRTLQLIQENDLAYNIQSVFNYYPETNGGFLHVEVEKLQDGNPNVDLVVYVVQDSIRDWQRLPDGGGDIPDYLHKNIHKGNIDNQPWGQPLDFSTENKVYKDYSYAIPAGMTAENTHFLIFVSDATTKKIYQVIKQKVIG